MNVIYDGARELAATTGLGWPTEATVHAYLIDLTQYLPQPTHVYLNEVPVGARVAGPVALTSRTASGGACDAADFTFTAVSGPEVGALLVVYSSGVESTSRLIVCVDQGTNLPIIPNGSDIAVTVDPGVNRLFRV